MLEMSQSFPGLQAQVAGLHLIFLILAVPSTRKENVGTTFSRSLHGCLFLSQMQSLMSIS